MPLRIQHEKNEGSGEQTFEKLISVNFSNSTYLCSFGYGAWQKKIGAEIWQHLQEFNHLKESWQLLFTTTNPY